MTSSNISKDLNLIINVYDYNVIHYNDNLLSQLRELTLDSKSGMNYELNNFKKIIKERPVKCQVILAYHKDNLIAWALLSNEFTDFTFPRQDRFDPKIDGTMFQIFVHPQYRRCGIGKQILNTARRLTEGQLCVCPWDNVSGNFFQPLINNNEQSKFL